MTMQELPVIVSVTDILKHVENCRSCRRKLDIVAKHTAIKGSKQ